MYSNFRLGTLHVSKAVRRRLGRTPLDLIARHAVEDHGLITTREAALNSAAKRSCGAIISRYYIDPCTPAAGTVLVITYVDWTKTRVILEKRCRSSSSSPAQSAPPTKPCAQPSGS